MKYKPLFVLVTLLLAACGGGKTESNSPAPIVDKGGKGDTSGPTPRPGVPPVPVTPLGEIKLTARVEPTPLPNQYQVIVQWSFVGESPEGWVLDRTETPGGAFRSHGRMDGVQRQFLDTTAAAGKSYRYVLDSLKDAARTKLAQLDVTIPRDLELRDVHELESISGIERLFLRKGAVLRPKANGLFLRVASLISEDASIESFPLGKEAPTGSRGRDGMPLVVMANHATGSLRILPRGENGGRGLKGRTGGIGAMGSQGNVPFPFGEPRPGGPGGQGEAGGPGYPGHDGGDASAVYVEIANPSGFDFPQPIPLPGKGGPGGEGGDGGPGGPGGFPPNGHDDNRALFGANGAPGLAGPASLVSGNEGLPKPICLKLGSATIGDCAKFPVPPTLVR